MSRRLAAVLAVAVLAGCGAAADGGSSDASTGAQGAGPEVLHFSAPIVGGGELDASTLAGQPVAFWFWAPT